MRVVDFHTHFFSRTFFDTLAALAPPPGERELVLAKFRAKTDIEVPSHDVGEHVARWIKELDDHRVDHMLTFASLPEEIPTVAEAVRRAKGRISACALVNPKTPGCIEDLWSVMTQYGFHGVLLFPALHHYHVSEEAAAGVLKVLDDQAGIAFVHCGMLTVHVRDLFELPRPYDLRYANPLDIMPAANHAPRTHFVIPHFGGGLFRETLMAGLQCNNIYVDTSSSHSWMRVQARPTRLRDVFAQALDVFGPERILFGTDSGVFPAGWRNDRLEEQQAALDALGISAADQHKILAGNAVRLLGLDESA